MKQTLLLLLLLTLPAALAAQACGFSEGKNLAQLRAAVFAKNLPPMALGKARTQLPDNWIPKESGSRSCTPAPRPLVFLPRWSAEQLPFFCKLEHDWGIKSSVPFKFRLGSVEYVDWLEGK
ncbi:MAG: hypothetical protein ACKVUS_19945 [Saprospiraceae bacterium]